MVFLAENRWWIVPGRRRRFFGALAFALILPTVAQAACRQALVLALDVSGSVNAREYAQQVAGLAAALDDPEVRELILDGAAAPVELLVFEWSSRNHQFLIQPWTSLTDADVLDAAIARIRGYRKQRAGLKTAMGTALQFAGAALSEKAHCWRRTVDISADGKNNIGPAPREAYALPIFAGTTVNALVIGDPHPERARDNDELQHYFRSEVIHGPGAFSMVANGYADYARAMKRKLVRELKVPEMGRGSAPRLKPFQRAIQPPPNTREPSGA